MVYEIYETETVAGATVRYGFDTGGPVGATNFVSVESDEYSVNRFFYFDEWDERYAENFARKIATDDEYRAASLDGTADWKQISDIYDEFSRRVLDQ